VGDAFTQPRLPLPRNPNASRGCAEVQASAQRVRTERTKRVGLRRVGRAPHQLMLGGGPGRKPFLKVEQGQVGGQGAGLAFKHPFVPVCISIHGLPKREAEACMCLHGASVAQGGAGSIRLDFG